MPSVNKFNSFAKDVHEAMNLATDTIKVLLTNTAPVATNTVIGDITEIAAGNGYTAGGATVANQTSGQTAGAYKFSHDDVVFTAAGGSIGPFRYAVWYDVTAGNKLMGWLDHGSAITLADGQSYTLDVNPTNGVFAG
jgi:hypothetical protein